MATDDNAEDRFEDGHLLLLSDLLLICRTKTQDEISRNVDGNISTHWLLFPPLAVRHVIAADATQADQGKNNYQLCDLIIRFDRICCNALIWTCIYIFVKM